MFLSRARPGKNGFVYRSVTGAQWPRSGAASVYTWTGRVTQQVFPLQPV